MRIDVKLFAILRDQAGVSEMPLELPLDATVAEALRSLEQRLPALRQSTRRIAFAVNRRYAQPDVVLQPGDELALIPPVSGG